MVTVLSWHVSPCSEFSKASGVALKPMQQFSASHVGLTPTVAGATTAAASQEAPTEPAFGLNASRAAVTIYLPSASSHVSRSASVIVEYALAATALAA